MWASLGELEVELVEGKQVIKPVKVLKTGLYSYWSKDDMNINKDVIRQMVTNFHDGVKPKKPQKVPIDYNHGSLQEGDGRAAGWIQDLEFDEKSGWLLMYPKFTKRAQQLIADEEYKYTSATFALEGMDNKGKGVGAYLAAVALTNRPFIDGQSGIEFKDNTEVPPIQPILQEESMENDTKGVTVEMFEAMKTTNATLEANFTAVKNENAELRESVTALVKSAKHDKAVAFADSAVIGNKVAPVEHDLYVELYENNAELATKLVATRTAVVPAGRIGENTPAPETKLSEYDEIVKLATAKNISIADASIMFKEGK